MLELKLPKQNRRTSVSNLAEKYGLHPRSVARHLKEMGATKSREQYEKDAHERRKIVYELRESGLKWREIAEKLSISPQNAQMLAYRYKKQIEG